MRYFNTSYQVPFSPFLPRPEQKTCWTQFIEVLNRYSLCSGEIEDQTLPHLTQGQPQFTDTFFDRVGTVVDASDSDQIVEAYLKKIKPLPTLGELDDYVSALLGYTCSNFKLNQTKFDHNLSRIVRATLGWAWSKLSKAHEMDRKAWKRFVDSVMDIPPTLVLWVSFLCIVIIATCKLKYTSMCEANRTKTRAIMAVATSEDLFELLGRLMLFPLSLSGGMLIGKRRCLLVVDTSLHEVFV